MKKGRSDENVSHRIFAGIDWKHRSRRRPRCAVAALPCGKTDVRHGNQSSNSAAQNSMGNSMAQPPASTEAPLVPVQISPQRLQSIGVKTGEVERKPVADEIRTTGSVAVDERRLAYVQVRFSGYIQKVFADATYQYVQKGSRYSQFTARS